MSPIGFSGLITGEPVAWPVMVLGRRLWAHPGVVETMTTPDRPWALRRLAYQLNARGWKRAVRWIERPGTCPVVAPPVVAAPAAASPRDGIARGADR